MSGLRCRKFGDPELAQAIWSSVVGDESICPVISMDDFSRFRAALRHKGVAVEIRAASIRSLDGEATFDAPCLLVHRLRSLFVLRHLARFECHQLHGQNPMTQNEVAAELGVGPRGEAHSNDWNSLGLENGIQEKLQKEFSPQGLDVLVDVLNQSSELGLSTGVLAEIALEHPEEFPAEIGRFKVLDGNIVEIRFVRQLQLCSGRSPLHTIFDLLKMETGFVAKLLLVGLFSVPFGFGVTAISATLIDQARVSTSFPWFELGFSFLLVVSGLVVLVIQGYGATRLAARLRIRLTNAFVFRVLGANISSLRELADGDIITRLADLFAIQGLVFNNLLSMITTGFMLTGSLIYINRLAGYLLPLVGMGALLVAVGLMIRLPEMKRLRYRRLEFASILRERLLERVEGWMVFRRMDRTGRLFSRVDPLLATTARLDLRQAVIASQLSLASGLIGAMVMVLALWSVSTQLNGGNATLGTVAVVVGILGATYAQVIGLVNVVPQIVLAEPALRRLNELIGCTDPEPIATSTLPSVRGPASLEVRDLVFQRPRSNFRLGGINLQVEPGEWIAVVGPSGGGKSTLASIIGGIDDPHGGHLHLDGHDAVALGREFRRHRAMVVPQEIFLFNRSIGENLVMGNYEATAEDISRVIEQCGLKKCLARQPLGLGQPVGDNGQFLSVGEKCRIGIARALLRSPGLIILDEALARQDNGTAIDICQNLRKSGCSVIVITHDLLQTQICDRIYVIDKGVNVETGTFDSLVRSGGLFSKMFRSRRRE